MNKGDSNGMGAVLTVRQRKEDQAERCLLATQQLVRQVMLEIHVTEQAISTIGESHLAEVQCLANGVHHHEREASYLQLRKRRDALLSQKRQLEKTRDEHMAVYLAARRAREVISDIESRRLEEHRRHVAREEAKRSEDLFMCRFGRT